MTEHTVSTRQPGTEFVISRQFALGRERLFKLWTDCEHLKRWFGPKGYPMVTCENELRPSGRLLYLLKAPDGTEFWGRWIYREITPPERLEVIAAFSDGKGGVMRHPLAPNWPLQTRSITTFTEQDGGTMVTVRWSPYEASDIEAKTFNEGHDGMVEGWSGTFEQLEAYLAELQAA